MDYFKKCPQCNEGYVTPDWRRIFCSLSCASRAKGARRPDGRPVSFKTGRSKRKSGYITVWVPEIGRNIMEHRIVMEKILGRPLHSWEHVHHKNHIRDDNRPENLEVLVDHKHRKLHGRNGAWASGGLTCCRDCQRSDRPHLARGLCRPCYEKQMRLEGLQKFSGIRCTNRELDPLAPATKESAQSTP
ncbi:hypothetical protein DYQ86_16070 [Acidobacteria bacterium AB60]|nr:hypothetical protein DYQ86_16070 [Acidobacteria bacterium AB60]